MKFYSNGEKIKFKNSKKTIELKPTYTVSDSKNDSVRSSWTYRYDKYEDIKEDQKNQDDIETIKDTEDYLKEQLKTKRDGLLALSIISAASYIVFKEYGLDRVEANTIDFYDIYDYAFTSSFFLASATFTISTISGYIKDVCSKIKLKSIKKEVEKNIEEQKEIEKKNTPVEEKKEKTIKVIEAEPIKKLSEFSINRYEAYKKYELEHGADPKLFDLPAIRHIIEYVIVNGDPRVKMEGRSPIYYSDPNEDGTFNICGRMGGPYVTLMYKMEYCEDDNPEHFIVLKRFDTKTHNGSLGVEFDGVGYEAIYINKEGNVVEETPEIIIDGFSEYDTLLNQLKKKKYINKIC